MDPSKQPESAPAVEQEPIDFASAKNFWQTRAARAQSREELPVPLVSSSSSSSLSTTSSTHATAASVVVEPQHALPAPSTPIEKYPDELEEEDDANVKHKDTKAQHSPPPAPTTATATNTAAAAALQRMTSFRSKFFSNNTETKSEDTSLPSLPNVQLPDMSVWKGKMKNIRGATPPKMNFSFEKLSTQLKTSLSNASLVVSDAERAANLALARNNLHKPNQQTGKPGTSASTYVKTDNAFGELIVAEVLAAKDLSAGDFFQGESDPYVVVCFREWERRTAIVKGTKNPVFNERFVFWIPPPSSADEAAQDRISIVLRNKNMVMTDEHLGEVHISLDVPVNEAFDEWYPLVKENGEQKGQVRVGVRRMEMTSAELQAAGQALAANNRSLNDEDLAAHGSVLPGLWYGFAEAAEPLETKASQADVLATKLNDLSRRFIGIEIASTELTADGKRRDIF